MPSCGRVEQDRSCRRGRATRRQEHAKHFFAQTRKLKIITYTSTRNIPHHLDIHTFLRVFQTRKCLCHVELSTLSQCQWVGRRAERTFYTRTRKVDLGSPY